MGESKGYVCGIHIATGNRYGLPRKLTAMVPLRCSSNADAPFSNAVSHQLGPTIKLFTHCMVL